MPSCFDMGEEDREDDLDRGIHELRSTAMVKGTDGSQVMTEGKIEPG